MRPLLYLALTHFIRNQNKPNQDDIRRISTLDTEIESTTAELERLQSKSSKIEEAIKGLEKRILEIGGSKLLSQKSKIDGIRLMINLANDEITKAEVSKAKAEKDITKLASSIEVNESTYEEYEGEVRGLQETLQELQTYLGELKARCDEAQQAADNSKEDLDELKKELDEKEEQIQGFLKKQVCALLMEFFFSLTLRIASARTRDTGQRQGIEDEWGLNNPLAVTA